jgi:hypothetical protein
MPRGRGQMRQPTSLLRLPGLCVLSLVLTSLAACKVSVPEPLGSPEPPTTESTLSPASEHAAPIPEVSPSATTPSEGQSPTPLAALADTPDPDAWMSLPVVPAVGQTAREIYRRGLELGNDPGAFSKIGDCQNVPSMFLAIFDDPNRYRLGDYAYLQETIAHFSGSFSRQSQAVRRGFNAASVLSPFWADPASCDSGETPLVCELRLHRPSIALISLETWWEGAPENYERYLRQIVEYTIDQGVVPIVATKADNLEGDWQINAAIARIARDYDIPLWNFWAAVQPLPAHGLRDDGFHLTFDLNYFDDPVRMRAAWPWRNLTALQALDAVWLGVSGQSAPGYSPAEAQ